MTKNKRFYGLLVFSLVLLFNPNLTVVDILPDFIGYFILARLFERAADSAPYFEEARAAFSKLGWLNIAKIPALFLIIIVRSKNTIDNDIFALTSISFATAELILMIIAIKNLFYALFHLGERTNAASLISPFMLRNHSNRTMTPEALRTLSFIFAGSKCLLYTLPDMFLLTRTTNAGQILTISKYYPYVLLVSLTFGIIIGSIWLSKTLRYVRAIHNEGLFVDSLKLLASEDTELKLEEKSKIRALCFSLTMLAISSFFSFDLIFQNFNGVDLLPNFIYGILLTFTLYKLSSKPIHKATTVAFGSLYSIADAIYFKEYLHFSENYDQADLIKNEAARYAYQAVHIYALLEFISLIAFLIIGAIILRDFIYTNTGTERSSDRYLKMEKEYHSALLKRGYIMILLSFLLGAAKYANVILQGDVQIIFSDITDVTRPAFAASSMPWFNTVVTVCTILYIAYSLYLSSTLKEEIKMKYKTT